MRTNRPGLSEKIFGRRLRRLPDRDRRIRIAATQQLSKLQDGKAKRGLPICRIRCQKNSIQKQKKVEFGERNRLGIRRFLGAAVEVFRANIQA